MWDILITGGNLVIIPALLATALDKRAYIPRMSSGVTLAGVIAVIVGMVGAGLVFSPIVLGVIGLIWLYIFWFRHQPGEATSVTGEVSLGGGEVVSVVEEPHDTAALAGNHDVDRGVSGPKEHVIGGLDDVADVRVDHAPVTDDDYALT